MCVYSQVRLPVNYLVLRGRAPGKELTALARREVAVLDPYQAIANAATIGDLLHRNTARQRFLMALLLSFELTSFLLTAAGIYSVISVIAEAVSLRTREIAIRLRIPAKVNADSERNVKGVLEPLFASKVSLRGLNRNVTQKELNLF